MSTTEASLSAVYGDESMNSTLYHLHAVLVHQGQASGGHYWSYVRKPPSLHFETPPTVSQAKPTSTEIIEPPQLTRTVSNLEPAVSSPAMSTESGGGGEGEETQSRGGEEKRGGAKVDGVKRGPVEEKGDVWLKFNDVSVHKVRWSEVVKESYGGHHNTSAYCLIYLSPLLHEAWTSNRKSGWRKRSRRGF